MSEGQWKKSTAELKQQKKKWLQSLPTFGARLVFYFLCYTFTRLFTPRGATFSARNYSEGVVFG